MTTDPQRRALRRLLSRYTHPRSRGGRSPARLRRSRGLSLLELMVVLGVIGLATAIAAPRFQSAILVRRLEARMQGVQAVFKQAQSLSAKLNVTIVVEPLFGDDAELRVFADYWDAGTSSSGSDLVFTEGTADRVVLRWLLQGEGRLPVYFWSLGSDEPEDEDALRGFTPNPLGVDLPPLVVFAPPSGRVQDRGVVSISLAGGGGGQALCRELSIITLIGQTRISPCSEITGGGGGGGGGGI